MSISYLKEQIAEERKPNMTADEIVREELRIAMFDFSRHPFSYASQPNEEKKHKVVNFDSKLSDSSAILVLSILLEVRVNERKAIINECGKIMKYHE
jgi:hypothetical protein